MMNIQKWINRILKRFNFSHKVSVEITKNGSVPVELFNADQMERHASSLALSHTLAKKLVKDILLERLFTCELSLAKSCHLLTEKTDDNFSPAREWLLDNFYLIQEQIYSIRRNLPKGYGRALPQLSGISPGCPRVYSISLEIIEHGDGRWDEEGLSRFIKAYQTVTPLTLGELWAIPITLGIALIENLSRASERIINERGERNLADFWANRMIKQAVLEPKKLVNVVAEMARSDPHMTSSFVAELSRRLQGAALALPLSWIEQHLAQEGLTIEQLVFEENKRQAANQVTVSNSIASLQRLAKVDWHDFVESMSVVEHILSGDPAGIYSQMDFGTRDHYRHQVERLANKSNQSEQKIAEFVIQLAFTSLRSAEHGDLNGQQTLLGHVGFYLIGAGLSELKQVLGLRSSFWNKLGGFFNRYALPIYLGSISVITIGFTYSLLFRTNLGTINSMWLFIAAIPLSLYGSQLAITLVNLATTILAKPQLLPRMDFSKGIPQPSRTLVVVPALLGGIAEIETLLEGLEVRFLGNRDPHLHYMLLTDFKDAPTEYLPEDDDLIQQVEQGIKALNQSYPQDNSDIFFLCHRPRLWNSHEGIWMGKERKRGKLMDLNNLLRGNVQSSFSLIVGRTEILNQIKYVITLDADTQLFRESARAFVATMAHPLNRPIIDESLQRVVEGYGILQPRVAEALPVSGQTQYLQLVSSEFGLDPYTRAISNLYQDVFHEGSFIGKGIYDVDVFKQVLEGRLPDNRILSHDLLEGCYLRSGLLCDVPLYEESPGSYLVDVKRRTRWIRGDWQLGGWLLPRVLDESGKRVPNPLSYLSKWKLFDNLRRSLVPVALFALLEWSLIILPATGYWLCLVLIMLALPAILNSVLELVRKPTDTHSFQHVTNISQIAFRQVKQLVLYLICLPHEAYYSSSAILQTSWRILVSKQHLLEWAHVGPLHQLPQDRLMHWIKSMWIGPFSAVISMIILWHDARFMSLLSALPLLFLWFFSPLIMHGMSQPNHAKEEKPSESQTRFLRRLARRTWGFFERFMTEDNHYLPPDNFQETPVIALARRTSPTNMGMALLANLTAYDFGYINMKQCLLRTQYTLQTMSKLERYRGHFYNWYDTETLLPLLPRYVSSVDSGNLAGHLLTLRQGLLALPDDLLLNGQYLAGIQDTWDILATDLVKTKFSELSHFETLLRDAQSSFDDWNTALQSCHELCKSAQLILAFIEQANPTSEENSILSSPSPSAQLSSLSPVAQLSSLRPVAQSSSLSPSAQLSSPSPVAQLSSLRPAACPRDPEISYTEKVRTGSRGQAAGRRDLGLEWCRDLGLEWCRDLGLEWCRDLALEWSNKLLLQCDALRDEISVLAKIPGLSARATLRELALLQPNLVGDDKNNASACLASIELIDQLANLAFNLAQMDFTFLYNESSHLMMIGFNVDEHQADPSSYDLLSSEARLGSFIAIAQGQALKDSWFALGRMLVAGGGKPILVSWSGSMFEYLMPLLVMPTYSDTLLDQTYHSVVKQQIAYGQQRGVPWGISESGYQAVDIKFNYLYKAFGVPGLGLKRGLEDDLVIAPYASVMALMVAPKSACQNLQRLVSQHALGQYGFYEAIDYTVSRLPPNTKQMLVQSFMAHHQGMSLLALSYLLNDKPMQRRFVADPLLQATLLLLQERIPKPNAVCLQIPKSLDDSILPKSADLSIRAFDDPNTDTPEVQLLSNGRYHLMLTQAGGSYSRFDDIALTRWREDPTCDDWGMFSYLRDIDSGEFWSTSYQPTLGNVKSFKAIFTESKVEFIRSDLKLDLHTEIVVSPEDNIELRRLRVHNRSKVSRTIEFTSYAEIVLAPQSADLAQPAFSNLFVETELLKEQHAILASRRPLDSQQTFPWLCHMLNIYGKTVSTISYETDRLCFVGRGHSLANPLAMIESGDLTNTVGAVLDPIVAIRSRVTLEPDDSVIFDLLTGAADTRELCIALVNKYQDRYLANRIFRLAWTHAQVLLHHLNISDMNAQLYTNLAGLVIYASHLRRADATILASNRRGQSALWAYSISGDCPIVLLQLDGSANIEWVQQLIQAQSYWRCKGLVVDLIILYDEQVSYRQALHGQIMSLISGKTTNEQKGRIVVLNAHDVPVDDHLLFKSIARVVISDKQGSLKEQMGRQRLNPPVMPMLVIKPSKRRETRHELPPLPDDLQFFNGLGGFTRSGDEYMIRLTQGYPTPAPWANVLANPNFGTLVSESGQGYTWFENAHEFRLTTWDNDPLKDPSGEAFYLGDNETGHIWSPQANPSRGNGDYQTRHGFGYSVYEHIEEGIYSELWVYVAIDESVKFSVLKIRNLSKRTRQLSAAGFVEWVLGDVRSKHAMHLVTELSPSGAILVQNHYNTEFAEKTAFFNAYSSHLKLSSRSLTGDRTEFIGRNGTYAQPAGLKRKKLSGRVGAGFDPCAAIKLVFDLEEGQSREIVFTLGAENTKSDAERLVTHYHGRIVAEHALMFTRQHWQRTLNQLQIKTPDESINIMANGWLLYQIISSRLWGRTGYYQSSGAFGFRDQLQDVLALCHTAPKLFRRQIELCAAHQFEEGDVQHWWHPPNNRGVRTRCSDDYLWLPYALIHYIETTGDRSILDLPIPFLQGRPLNPNEETYYESSTMGTEAVSLYQHAVRSITHGLQFGAHGLPLMGSGDWNDGMNKVGIDGRGESIWLGFFLYNILQRFAPIAQSLGDSVFNERCQAEGITLKQHLDRHGWDGEWYRRAYFDDGSPLGSKLNDECKIDSIAQSWSVLSGVAEPKRASVAMNSLYRYLVCESDELVKLLAPPFNHSKPSPGYIEGYVPGIRENGGQYTHAAIWAAMAFAQLGDKDRAWHLLHMLNPINHARNAWGIKRYKIEPYVMAGDVYSVAPHIGRGGWSWYTGSASWFYRLITETLLGIHIEEGKRLRLTPILPDDWDGFNLDYTVGSTLYKISISRTTGLIGLELDGVLLHEDFIHLKDDGQVHQVHLRIHHED